ncbi:cupin domain-containing protein [Roseovarius sp. LXJ103]|uniref:cupin domain-containing protein n=1 Tax=Roseovarius carneus TaxID=2853164 RepID=UPI000D60D043|nr:cupin domain-containing protein [Roseovarius carneus]MBZ8119272.1 cupin domain-containing protein [Roseovarius carneus]PWE35105.1 cupin [Pelagicola sp. LXJ1103]
MCKGSGAGTAVPKVFIDNERTRVTEWRFAARGDNTGWHRHEYDYVVVPVQDGFLELTDPDGKMTRAELKTGVPYFKNLGVEHDVVNGNDFEFAFMEVEFKDSAAGGA